MAKQKAGVATVRIEPCRGGGKAEGKRPPGVAVVLAKVIRRYF